METTTVTHGNDEYVKFEAGDHEEVVDAEFPVMIEKECKISRTPQQVDLTGICKDTVWIYKKHGKLIIEYSTMRKGKIVIVKSK